MIHALDHEVVPISEGERLVALARQPKGFGPAVAADHRLTDRDAAAWVVRVIVVWLNAAR